MRKPGIRLPLALVLSLAAAPLSLSFASGFPLSPTHNQQELAYSLDEMNCFSSDIQARAAIPDNDRGEPSGTRLADERGGGSNGIPCAHRDPKSPPTWRKQS